MNRFILPLRTWLLFSYLVVLALPLGALWGTGALAMDLRAQTALNLDNQGDLLALMLAREIGQAVPPGAPPEVAQGYLSKSGDELSELLANAKEKTLAGIRVVDHTGVVVASSGSGLGESLADQLEIQEALAGNTGSQVRPRPPPTGRGALSGPSRRARVRLFVAKPIELSDDTVVAAVVFSRTPREELQALYQMAPRLWWGVVLALLCTLSLAVLAGYYGSRSLRRLSRLAGRLSQGDRVEPQQLARGAHSHVREVRELTETVEKMATLVQARVDYINEFAGHVAHEFRTPLATLRGTAELLHDDESMPPEQRVRFLDNALQELDRLEQLMDGLLALARAERPHARSELDLDDLCTNVCARYPDIAFELGAGKVRGSRQQLDAVVENLVDNARTHGGEQPTIRV
ncbi:MAG: histidine kinase dimerization/phospho-acceptor domain-containing protein, partial [Nannocystaceae bacterium]